MRIFDLGGRGKPRAVHDRIVTLPNAVTLLRLMAVPFVFRALDDSRFTLALILLVVFAATDWIDGFLARALNQVSRLGALLDPAVDRIFIIAVAYGLFVADLVPLWALLVVVARDAGVLLIAGVLVARQLSPPPVSRLGKIGSFAVVTAAVLVVASEVAAGTLALLLSGGAAVVFIAGAITAYVATAGYARALRPSVH
ncbi:MAG: CDP-alcohol phosphatidyltransferase family protein [Nitriliruptoraceae bacterium]